MCVYARDIRPDHKYFKEDLHFEQKPTEQQKNDIFGK